MNDTYRLIYDNAIENGQGRWPLHQQELLLLLFLLLLPRLIASRKPVSRVGDLRRFGSPGLSAI